MIILQDAKYFSHGLLNPYRDRALEGDIDVIPPCSSGLDARPNPI